MSIQIQKPMLLIVEGQDEQFFFEAVLRDHLGLTNIRVMAIGGKTLLTRNLIGLTTDPNFATVVSRAIVRDANETIPGATVPSAAQAMQSVRGSLIHVGLPHPAAHGQFAAGPLRVGVFIVPNGVNDANSFSAALDSTDRRGRGSSSSMERVPGRIRLPSERCEVVQASINRSEVHLDGQGILHGLAMAGTGPAWAPTRRARAALMAEVLLTAGRRPRRAGRAGPASPSTR
jgi:hypothetical protein